MNNLVVLNVPVGTEFGIDYKSHRTAQFFLGLKLIPNGLHFIFWSAASSDGNNSNTAATRLGCFLECNDNQTIIREWDHNTESVTPPINRTEQELAALKSAVHNFQFDSQLGSYHSSTDAKIWKRLSKHISSSVLKRCKIQLGTVLHPGDLEEEGDFATEITAKFTDLRIRISKKSLSEVTAFHFDTSEKLQYLIESVYDSNPNELLGEFQLAFILFLHLSSYQALIQWKNLFVTICSANSGPSFFPELYQKVLRVIYDQLRIAGEAMDEILDSSRDSFLKTSLGFLFEILDDDDDVVVSDKSISINAKRLYDFVSHRFGFKFKKLCNSYDFMHDDNELSPAIVLPDELPSSVFSQDATDSEEFNTKVALEFLKCKR